MIKITGTTDTIEINGRRANIYVNFDLHFEKNQLNLAYENLVNMYSYTKGQFYSVLMK